MDVQALYRRVTTAVVVNELVALTIAPPPSLAQTERRFEFSSQHEAVARFEGVDASGCIQHEVLVVGINGQPRSPGGPPAQNQFAWVSVYVLNRCISQAYSIDGTTTSNLTVQVRPELSSATVTTATFDAIDQRGDHHTVSVNLTWSDMGQIITSRTYEHFATPGIEVFLNHFNLRVREGGHASGTILLDGTNLSPTMSTYAGLGFSDYNTLYIRRT